MSGYVFYEVECAELGDWFTNGRTAKKHYDSIRLGIHPRIDFLEGGTFRVALVRHQLPAGMTAKSLVLELLKGLPRKTGVLNNCWITVKENSDGSYSVEEW